MIRYSCSLCCQNERYQIGKHIVNESFSMASIILAGCKIYGIKELEAIELLCLGGLEKK